VAPTLGHRPLLLAGTVRSQLGSLLSLHNAHTTAPSAAHPASAIAARPHAFVRGTSVQAQLEEVVASLALASPTVGSSLVGSAAIDVGSRRLPAGTVRSQLEESVRMLTNHAASADHDPRYLREVVRASLVVQSGATARVGSYPFEPHNVSISYNYVNQSGADEPVTYFEGLHSPLIYVTVRKDFRPLVERCF
jgi:hypothetical protein